MEQTARALEEKFPQLKDDVTNSLLLFREVEEAQDFARFLKDWLRPNSGNG
jgi:hypothetical protein